MAHIEKDTMVTRHITFNESEYAAVKARAEAAGMQIAPFIRREAVYGYVKGFPLDALTEHVMEIDQIAAAITEVTQRDHPDRWLYQADLERIDTNLTHLLALEVDILKQLQNAME